jgi:hypothetical protein
MLPHVRGHRLGLSGGAVAWDGEKVFYFEHEERKTGPPLRPVPWLAAEWFWIWGAFWISFLCRFPISQMRRT